MKKQWTKEHIEFMKETSHLLSGEAYKLFYAKFPEREATYSAFSKKRSLMRFCKQDDKKLFWTKEKRDFLQAIKDLSKKEAYKEFCFHFGENMVSYTAFSTQRSRQGLAKKCSHGTTKERPLYSEHIKKGYVFIKIAKNPAVWISKAQWVWQETHPGETAGKNDSFYFLDGNNRNFDPKNIERVNRRLNGIIAQMGAVEENCPDATHINILRARLKLETFDLAEKAGLCYKSKRGRSFKK